MILPDRWFGGCQLCVRRLTASGGCDQIADVATWVVFLCVFRQLRKLAGLFGAHFLKQRKKTKKKTATIT
jgi:hypothetical protein